jgi:hypothetical protein
MYSLPVSFFLIFLSLLSGFLWILYREDASLYFFPRSVVSSWSFLPHRLVPSSKKNITTIVNIDKPYISDFTLEVFLPNFIISYQTPEILLENLQYSTFFCEEEMNILTCQKKWKDQLFALSLKGPIGIHSQKLKMLVKSLFAWKKKELIQEGSNLENAHLYFYPFDKNQYDFWVGIQVKQNKDISHLSSLENLPMLSYYFIIGKPLIHSTEFFVALLKSCESDLNCFSLKGFSSEKWMKNITSNKFQIDSIWSIQDESSLDGAIYLADEHNRHDEYQKRWLAWTIEPSKFFSYKDVLPPSILKAIKGIKHICKWDEKTKDWQVLSDHMVHSLLKEWKALRPEKSSFSSLEDYQFCQNWIKRDKNHVLKNPIEKWKFSFYSSQKNTRNNQNCQIMKEKDKDTSKESNLDDLPEIFFHSSKSSDIFKKDLWIFWSEKDSYCAGVF